jgi:hypothetical protein
MDLSAISILWTKQSEEYELGMNGVPVEFFN